MFTDVHWIENEHGLQLAIAARPRSGDWLEDEIAHWERSGVQHVVSLLEHHEVEELELHAEASTCKARGIAFTSFPIPDRGVPEDRSAAIALAQELGKARQSVVVHCRAGIGRSSTIAAAVLVLLGQDPNQALDSIANARGLPVPDTQLQRDWLLALA